MQQKVKIYIDPDEVYAYLEAQNTKGATYVWNAGADDDPLYGIDGYLDDVLEAIGQTMTYEEVL